MNAANSAPQTSDIPGPQELYVPSTWNRLWAKMVDGLIVLVPMSFWMVPIFRTVLRTGKVTIPWLEIVLTSIIGALYPCLFIKLKNATPGKLLFRLKIVDYETGSDRLTWAQVLLRVSAEYALTPLFSLGPMAVAFFREDRRHLIDIIARTRVVQDSPRRKKAEIRRILGTILVLYFGVGALYKLLGHKSYNYTREGLVMSLPRSPARK